MTIVRRNDPTTEANGGRDHERVDGQRAVTADPGEQMPGDPRRPCARRDDLSEPAGQDEIDGLVHTATSVQLHEHGGWDANGSVPRMSAPQDRSDALMASRVDNRPCERRHCLAVED
jgi:hypothetical protein